jgi:tetratricopeptide (TPR) repeat protein
MQTTEEAMAAIRANPDNARAWFALGQMLTAEGENEKARDSLRRALALDPSLGEAQRLLDSLDPRLLDEEIARLSAQGWLVVNRTADSAQLRRPKQWSRTGLLLLVLLPLVAGVLFLPFSGGDARLLWYVALGGLVVVTLDYLLKRDKLTYVTREEIASRQT